MTLEAATKILGDRENFASASPYEQALYTVLRDLQARVCKPDMPMREPQYAVVTEQFRQAWINRNSLNFHPVAMTMIWPRVGGGELVSVDNYQRIEQERQDVLAKIWEQDD